MAGHFGFYWQNRERVQITPEILCSPDFKIKNLELYKKIPGINVRSKWGYSYYSRDTKLEGQLLGVINGFQKRYSN